MYSHLTIGLVSVLVAIVIGGIETLGLIDAKLELQGPFWDSVSELADSFGTLGYVTIAIFALSWLLSMLIYRVKRYDEIEVRIG